MRRWLYMGVGTIAVAGLLAAIPAISVGGKGKLVAKDTGKGNSPVAVVRATIQNPGRLTFTIASKPKHRKVHWIYTTDCVKDGKAYQWPPPGKAGEKVTRSKVRKRMNKVVRNPDVCEVGLSGKLEYKSGKKVTAKIFNR